MGSLILKLTVNTCRPSLLNTTSKGSCVLSRSSATPLIVAVQSPGPPLLLPPGIKPPFHVTDKGAARASDEKNKLNKTKNTFSLRTPFIISSLFFLKKKKI